MLVRVSLGTLAALGMARIRMDAAPTTAYLLQYSPTGCMARCAFCPQSAAVRGSKDYVSRVPWPPVELDRLVEALSGRRVFRRICMQSVLKPGFAQEILELLRRLQPLGIPVSLSINPVGVELLKGLSRLSDYLGVGLDAATPKVFRLTGKPYSWETYWWFLERGVEVYGERHVYVHLVAGMGESEWEMAETMERVYRAGGEVALFAHTPIRGSPLSSRPDPCYYRRLQALRHLLSKGYRLREVAYPRGGRIVFRDRYLDEVGAEAMLTSGCPWCNRPYYNEGPRGPLYNYPEPGLLPHRFPVECLAKD